MIFHDSEIPFLQGCTGIGQACADVFAGEPWIIFQYLPFRPSLGKEIHDELYR